MKAVVAPAIDTRNADQLLFELLTRALGYVPEWDPSERTAGYGLAAIAARQVKTVLERVNQVPGKQKLALLDLLGLSVIPAQGARAPVTFKLQDQARGGSAPAGTRISAAPPQGSTQPIMFETERSTGIRAGKLAQVVSLWPGRDEYIDHSAAYAAGQPVLAFARSLLGPVPHHLYLSHSVLLALSGPVELGVEFELVDASRDALDLVWEYWDGKVWREFLSTLRECQAAFTKPLDGTNGLTSSGTVTLKADCAEAKETVVNGRNGYWIRARLDEPLPVDPDRRLASVERVRISSSVNRALRGRIDRIESKSPTPLFFPFLGMPLQQASSQYFVSGTVLNTGGQPVAGAVVFLHAGATVVHSVATQTDGRFTLPFITIAPDEKLALRVTAGGIEYAGPDGPVAVEAPGPFTRSLVFNVVLATDGLLPDKAFADATKLDLSKPFYPMGQQPQPGTTFYFSNEEVLSKPGAKVRMAVARTRSPQDEANIGDSGQVVGNAIEHQVVWEYWNSRAWAPLAVTSSISGSKLDLDSTEIFDFTVPVDITPVEVNDDKARWIRARLQTGSYGLRREVAFDTGTTPQTSFVYVLARPPVLADLRLGYTWQFGPFHPEAVITYNDFAYEDHTEESIWPGTAFYPFKPVEDVTPALYLGFNQPPPVDTLGIYFDVVEDPSEVTGPALAWQYWNGVEWRELPAEDETGNIRRAGMVSLVAQPDDASLARFGTSLYWFRGRLKEDGPPGEPVITGIFPNSVWATQRETYRDVVAGKSGGTPAQSMQITQTPVLPGERIEVRELTGARAAVEWRILALELFGGNTATLRQIEAIASRERPGSDVVMKPLRLARDRRDRVTDAWVEWEYRQFLNLSGPNDRHYTLDSASGLLQFGDGVNGKIPPAGADVVVKEMQSGGGLKGNVAAGTIKQLLGAISGVDSVTNPRAAEGGANTEPSREVAERGPRTIRHRGRAISASDYETMARESSPAVAVARALPSRNPAGARVPGWVTLMIVPHGEEPMPTPSFGLREHVRTYIEARACADLSAAHRVMVIGPQYFALDIAAVVAPLRASEAGDVEKRAVAALQSFLHPLYGGPGGDGWAPGRDVYLSDVASVLERVTGLDFVEEITLFKEGVPQGERVDVPEEFIVVAGALQISLVGGEA